MGGARENVEDLARDNVIGVLHGSSEPKKATGEDWDNVRDERVLPEEGYPKVMKTVPFSDIGMISKSSL